MTPETTTVRDARHAFFVRNGFGVDGGYGDEWSEAALGPIHYRVRNTPLRRATLRLHDLHHVATGYAADWRGESEISAWELASGLGRQPWAWVIALWGLFYGVLLLPRDTFFAFVRGRGSRNLYRADDHDVLGETVAALRARLRVHPDRAGQPSPWRPDASLWTRGADVAAFAGWSAASLLFGAVALVPVAVMVVRAALAALTPCTLSSSPTSA